MRALSLVGKPVTKVPDSFDTESSIPLAVKADKLVVPEEEQPPEKVTIKTTNITPSPVMEEVTAPIGVRPPYTEMRPRLHHAPIVIIGIGVHPGDRLSGA